MKVLAHSYFRHNMLSAVVFVMNQYSKKNHNELLLFIFLDFTHDLLLQAIQIYEHNESVYKRGHNEFLLAALDKMEEFGVHKDLTTFKVCYHNF